MARRGIPRLTSGGHELDVGANRFGFLRDSNDILADPASLRRRLNRYGYLYMPGFFERSEVLAVRKQICEVLAADGLLDPSHPPEAAIAIPDRQMYFRPDIAMNSAATPHLNNLIYGTKIMGFYEALLGGPARHYDYTWMRTIGPGLGTYPHCDVVYMGRGTKNLYTAWVPLGDVPLSVGGLILLEGSNRNEQLRRTYGAMDVDTACQNREGESQTNAAGYPGFGALSLDMSAVHKELGCKLVTAREYRMGDLLIFSIYTVHGSLDNHSSEIRISTDSRYQLASEPVDERWVGKHPPSHGGSSIKAMIC